MWSKYMPIVLLIYFFNSFLLPHGLLFSALLTPVFVYWIWKYNLLKYLGFAALGILIMDYFHYSNGAQLRSLFISSGLFFSAIAFAITVWSWIQRQSNPTWLMQGILKWNTLFILLAILIVPFGFGRTLMWYEIPISPGISSFPRLKLFTYEAAYYALLFAPVFLYFFWRTILGMEKRWLRVSIAILLPLAHSLSFGVTGALVLSLVITSVIYWSQLLVLPTFRKTLLYGSFSIALVVSALIFIYPDNPVFGRLVNIVGGQDTSARGRLIESFMFAYDLAQSKSLWFGAGLGQIKVLGHDLIINFYQYEGDFAEIVRIPNSMGELLATYGLMGVFLKISLEIYLFFKFKSYRNYFNLSLFLFVFIYQFTGSYLVNTAELMLWAAAFVIQFPDLKTPTVQYTQHESSFH